MFGGGLDVQTSLCGRDPLAALVVDYACFLSCPLPSLHTKTYKEQCCKPWHSVRLFVAQAYPLYVWLSLVPIVAGCAMSAMKEVSFAWSGECLGAGCRLGLVVQQFRYRVFVLEESWRSSTLHGQLSPDRLQRQTPICSPMHASG